MSVYIEYVIIDNLTIDAVIVYLSVKSAHLPARWYLVAGAATLGTVCALLLPMLAGWPAPAVVALKAAFSLAITLVAAKYPSLKKYLLTLLLFYAYTFLLGGICMGCAYFLGADIVNMATLTYSYRIPIGCIVGGVFGGYLLVRVLLDYGRRRHLVRRSLVELELTVRGATVRLTGFMDTGNRMFDDVTGYPVVIVHGEVLRRLLRLPDGSRDYGCLKKRHYQSFNTIGGEGKIFLFQPDKLVLFGKVPHTIVDVMVGVSENAVTFGEDYSVLLQASLLSETEI